jgi:hypothetical protein
MIFKKISTIISDAIRILEKTTPEKRQMVELNMHGDRLRDEYNIYARKLGLPDAEYKNDLYKNLASYMQRIEDNEFSIEQYNTITNELKNLVRQLALKSNIPRWKPEEISKYLDNFYKINRKKRA